MRALILTSLFALLFISGCASTGGRDLVPYTDALRAQHNLSDDEVRRLQYYLSDGVEMRRQDASADHRVVDGRLIATANRKLARVVVPAGIPGVATAVGGNRLNVSFAEGTHFNFSPATRDPASPYRMQATPTGNGQHRIFLYNTAYSVSSGGALPYLLIDRETLYRSSQETFRLPGRTLTD